jgi:hypothetical protein
MQARIGPAARGSCKMGDGPALMAARAIAGGEFKTANHGCWGEDGAG